MMDDLPEDNGRFRGRLTQGKRIELLERSSTQQARMITNLVEAQAKGFTPEQLNQLGGLFREELSGAGLRLDDADHVGEAREDSRWLRRMRLS